MLRGLTPVKNDFAFSGSGCWARAGNTSAADAITAPTHHALRTLASPWLVPVRADSDSFGKAGTIAFSWTLSSLVAGKLHSPPRALFLAHYGPVLSSVTAMSAWNYAAEGAQAHGTGWGTPVPP